MASVFAGRLPLNPPVVMAVANHHDGTNNNNGEGTGTGTVLDQQLERMRRRDCRKFRYMFLYCVILDDLNRFRVVGEKPAEAALKIGKTLQKYGMNTVQKLELSGDHNGGGGGKKMNVDGILRFLEQSPSLREFCYASQDKYLPPLYLKALQQNHHHILQRLELRCSHLPMEPLSDLIQSTKTLSYLSLDGNVHINRPYHISHQHLKTLCLALSVNKSLKEVNFFIMDFNHRNQNNTRKKLFTQHQNKTIETVRFRNGSTDAHSIYNLLHVMGNVKHIEWTYMGRHDQHLLDALSNIRIERQDVMLTEALGGGVELTLRKKSTQPLHLQITSHAGYPIDPTVMRNFVQCQQNLRSLSLDYGTAQSLQDFVMMSSKVLAEHPNPNLKTLSLKNAGDAGIKYLTHVPLMKLDFSAWAMEHSMPHLCHFLSQQDCTVQELTVCLHSLEGFGNLCLALKENRSIKTFSFMAEPNRPNHRPINESGYETLYRCLPDFSIEHLSFSGPGIQREFTHWLFRALERNGNDYLKTLEIESLEAGLLEMESIVLLCRYLHQPGCRLSTLTLHCGAIPDLTPDCMELLLLRLSSAPTPIENLSLSCNVSDLKTVSDYIPRIQTLKKLSLLVFNDEDEAWRSEKVKIDILIAIELSQSLSEFHCNMDEESHFFQNRIFFYNQRRKVDRILDLSDRKQPSLRLWPKIMEALQQENNCPSLLFHLLTSHSDTLFSRVRRRPTTSKREPIQEQHPASLEDKKKNEPPPETAPPLGYSSEVVSYSGCGCLPFFGWW